MVTFPQKFKIVQLLAPQTTNSSITSDVINLKNAVRAWIVIHFTQAVGHATTPTLNQATDVGAGTNAAGPASLVWANEDVAATDTLVSKTAGASYAVTNDIKNKVVVFEIDPSALTDGYSCVYITQASSSQATNYCSMEAIVLENFQRATPPSVIL